MMKTVCYVFEQKSEIKKEFLLNKKFSNHTTKIGISSIGEDFIGSIPSDLTNLIEFNEDLTEIKGVSDIYIFFGASILNAKSVSRILKSLSEEKMSIDFLVLCPKNDWTGLINWIENNFNDEREANVFNKIKLWEIEEVESNLLKFKNEL